MSAFACEVITVFIIYIQLFDQTTCQYNTIWFDDMKTNNAGWTRSSSSYTTFGFDTNGRCADYGQFCCITNGGWGVDEWVRRSTDISSYGYIRLKLHIATYLLYIGSTCNIYYSYASDDSSDKIEIKVIDPPDNTGGAPTYYFPDTVVDFPYSPSSNTIWIWFYSDSSSSAQSEYCVWSDVYLQGTAVGSLTSAPQPSPNPTKRPSPNPIKRPTPNPTKKPNPNPTNRPSPNPTPKPTSKPTQKPTPNPTTTPPPECVYISNFDVQNFNGEWESQDTYNGKNAYKKDEYWLFYSQDGSYYWGIYTSLDSGSRNVNVWDLGWCERSNIENCDGKWERDSPGVTDRNAQ
eukprot:774989_1